jgi:intracellular multiplication protein IcmB
MPALHEKALQLGINIDESTTWWELTDAFFRHGRLHEAIQAQRYAVPILDDIAAEVNQNDGIRGTYPEHIISEVWRTMMETTSQYVILKQPTQFDIGDAQIVSLDLDEVAPRVGSTANRQAAVMYLLARHILGSRFFLMPGDVDLMPELYQRYHARRIDEIREDPKRLCYDEAHRVTQNAAVSGQMVEDINTLIRESRKWNLSIGLYTQSVDDFPKIILNLATTVLILGSGTEQSIADLAEKFGLNGVCTYALGRLGKPGPAGANLVAVFKTGTGPSQLILTLTVGSQALWAFSTTTEDTSIRNELYSRLGVTKALDILARRFSGGSAKAEVERRKRNVLDTTASEAENFNVIKEIIEELHADANNML